MTRILYVQFTNPGAYPPLEHSSSILAEAGAEVLVMGTTASATARLAWPERSRITVNTMPTRESGVLHKLDYLRFGYRILRTIRRFRPHWLYVSDPLAAPIALAAKRLTGVRILYHEHDEPFAPHPSRLTRAIFRSRNRLARVAEEVVVPNAERGERLRRASGRRDPVRVVWNCPRRSEVRDSTAPAAGPLRLIYQGSIARERVPLTLIDVMAAIPSVELVVVGYETPDSSGHLSDLQREASRRGVADRLRITGSIPRSMLLETTATCHVGLSFMPAASGNPNEATMVGSSNKAFEYLACGLALLVCDVPEWQESFVAAGLARTCDPTSATSISSAVRGYDERRSELAAIGNRGRAKILSEWNYETQFAPLLPALLNPR